MTTPKEKRSQIMRAVRSLDTRPELIVRSLLHILGYRFRLHRKDLPGSPDLVFPSRKKIIFVHGCFGMAMRANEVAVSQRQIRTIGKLKLPGTGHEIRFRWLH